jgi:hypothetical protein
MVAWIKDTTNLVFHLPPGRDRSTGSDHHWILYDELVWGWLPGFDFVSFSKPLFTLFSPKLCDPKTVLLKKRQSRSGLFPYLPVPNSPIQVLREFR